MYKIRDWEKHFEQDRSKQWKHLRWVPIPNKQGAGYRKIMAQKDGLEIFACWIALVQQGSLCSPRGDLTKYDISDLSRLTLINDKSLFNAIKFLSQNLDWIEIIENLDKNVNNLDKNVSEQAVASSMLCNTILSSSLNLKNKDNYLNNYNIYVEDAKKALNDLLSDIDWLQERKRYHNNLNVKLTLEKAWKDFWLTEAGWKNKTKSKSDVIDWKRTANNALSQKCNQVWLEKGKENEPEKIRITEEEARKRGYIT